MKMHIEYDDFGEYIEVLEDEGTACAKTGSCAACRYATAGRSGSLPGKRGVHTG